MKTILADELQVMRDLSDGDFDGAFAGEVKAEARQSMRVVYFIREASRRRHWLGSFSTLAKYCAHHGISNGDFYRKLAILDTIRDLPEIEGKIINGQLNPTTVAQVNTFCRTESKVREKRVRIDEKRDLLHKAEGKSARQVERELVRISPKSAIPDKKRQIAEDLFSNQFTSDQSLENKMQRLRELLSNSLPHSPTQNELLHKVCDIALKRLENSPEKDKVEISVISGSSPINQNVEKAKESRYINAAAKRQLRKRDGEQCTFFLTNGQKCGAKAGLQIDHIVPFAKGGETTLDNLRQVCRNHNHWLAIQEFGRQKMEPYIKSL